MSEQPHDLPDWVKPLVQRFYPSRYRVIWSENHREMRFGEERFRYGEGRDRWMLEKWHPPPARAEWDAQMRECYGDYPNEGTWELSWAMELNLGNGMEYIPLREDVVRLMIQLVEASTKNFTVAQRLEALRKRREQEERDRRRLYDDIWRDAAPARGAKIPEHIQKMDSFSALTPQDLPLALPAKGLKQIGEVNAIDNP